MIGKTLPHEICGAVRLESFRVTIMVHAVLVEGTLQIMCPITDPGNTRLYMIRTEYVNNRKIT